MRGIKFTPPSGDPLWESWDQRVRKRRDAIVQAFNAYRTAGLAKKFPPPIDDDTYKGARPFILRAFSKKCAYCESAIEPALVNGDVEHFRPKKAVKEYRYVPPDDPTKDALGPLLSTFTDLPGSDHTGYFWMAYNIGNLLPSCPACNQYEKKNFFPVGGVRRLACDEGPDTMDDAPEAAPAEAAAAGEVDRRVEKPMLVNPYFDDPNLHFAFTDRKGLVRPLTLRGAISIDVYGLNREGLPEARAAVIRSARLEFSDWYAALNDRDDQAVAEKEEILNRYESGEVPYSAAALTHIGACQEQLLRRGLNFVPRRGIWPSTLKETISIA